MFLDSDFVSSFWPFQQVDMRNKLSLIFKCYLRIQLNYTAMNYAKLVLLLYFHIAFWFKINFRYDLVFFSNIKVRY